MTLYHGTSTAALPSIQTDGLIPHKGLGGDTWAARQGYALAHADTGPRHSSVYLAKDRAIAEDFAVIAAKQTGTKPVVVKVTVPEPQLEHVTIDENYYSDTSDPRYGSAVRYEGVIPPTWIAVDPQPVGRDAYRNFQAMEAEDILRSFVREFVPRPATTTQHRSHK